MAFLPWSVSSGHNKKHISVVSAAAGASHANVRSCAAIASQRSLLQRITQAVEAFEQTEWAQELLQLDAKVGNDPVMAQRLSYLILEDKTP
jgi:hypothetical protein